MRQALQPTPALSLDRVRRLSRGMQAACTLLLWTLPAGLVVFWATASDAALAEHALLGPQAIRAPLEAWQRLAAGVVSALPLAMLLAGVWQARRCFAEFAQGRVFTPEAAARLGAFAAWVAAAAAASMLAVSACSVLLTWNNPPGMRHLAFGVGSHQVFTLFFAGTVWLMAAVIAQGQGLDEENKGFV